MLSVSTALRPAAKFVFFFESVKSFLFTEKHQQTQFQARTNGRPFFPANLLPLGIQRGSTSRRNYVIRQKLSKQTGVCSRFGQKASYFIPLFFLLGNSYMNTENMPGINDGIPPRSKLLPDPQWVSLCDTFRNKL